MSIIESIPTFAGSATYTEFRTAYDAVQCVCFQLDRRPSNLNHNSSNIKSPDKKRKRRTGESDSASNTSMQEQHLASLQNMRDAFHAATADDQASWCIENDEDVSRRRITSGSTHCKKSDVILPSEFLSPSSATAPRRAYCSFVLQDDSNGSVKAFTEQHSQHSTLPIRTDDTPLHTDDDDDDASRPYLDSNKIFVTEPYWMFIGRNTSTTPMKGRSEHTDSIQHNGTFHYQMTGSKVWKLRPTEELRSMCNDRDVALLATYVHTVQEGDVFFVNTRLWWHQTELPGVVKTDGKEQPSAGGWSISFARDVYLDGLQPVNAADEYMSSISGVFANANIPQGTILLTELEELPSTMGRSKEKSKTNCEILNVAESADEEGHGGEMQMALVATRDILEGDFFIMLAATPRVG
jgi:hypothetical protein